VLEQGNHSLQWIHVSSDVDQPAADLVAALHALSDVPDTIDTLIVTSLAGSSEWEHLRFESLLNEDRIRLPLWLRTPSVSEGRCARMSGSHDILETILSALANGPDNGEASMADPLDLEAVFRNFDSTSERILRIDLVEGSALRTNDFLLARSESGDSEKLSIALYRKPFDMWNVHDVSHEYPDVVQSLMTRLNSI